MTTDASMDGFFSRPVKIKSILWASDNDVNAVFDPWSLYFEQRRVINRLTSYKLLQADLHVKVTINGTPFSYGRVIMAYNPLPLWDSYNVLAASGKLGICQQSQKPKIFIDPTSSEGGEMVLPFFWYKNALDVVNQDWRMLGNMELFSLNKLKTANGAATTLEISVFAWATNVKVAVPTQVNPTSLVPQSMEFIPHAKDKKKGKTKGAKDEYTAGDGPVSIPAGIIANLASRFKTVPYIGKYARATEIGATAMKEMASIFGYSKPALLEHSSFRPSTKSSLATVNNPDDLIKLSLDCKQETTIDPRTAGLGGEDEMTISYIAGKESWYDTFNWPLGATSESVLWSTIVDPGVYRQTGGAIMQTACSFAVQPFKYWRGSMIYRIQVVASQYHRGRLKFVYDPEGNYFETNGEAEYNTAYTTIVDITESSDFELTIGWGQASAFTEHIPWGTPESIFLTAAAKNPLYASSLDLFGNGTLTCYVVNELASPDDTINNDIEINVFVKAGPDFEVAMPTGESVTRMRISDDANPYPIDSDIPITDETTLLASADPNYKRPSRVRPAKLARDKNIGIPTPNSSSRPTAPPAVGRQQLPTSPSVGRVLPNAIPHSDEIVAAEARDTPTMNLPDSATPLSTMGAVGSLVDATNHVYFGEVVRSFRQLVKRYNRHENIPLAGANPAPDRSAWMKFQRAAWPSWPGYMDPPVNTETPAETLISGTYYYGMTTMLNYVPSAFAGYKGSTRVIADFSGADCCGQRSSLVATRYSGCQPTDRINLQGVAPASPTYRAFDILNFDDFTGQEGAMIQATSVNPTLSFEVPYYSNLRFTPTRQPQGFAEAGKFNTPCYKLGGTFVSQSTNRSKSIDLWYAAGEDFTCFFYVGPPAVYIESVPPIA